MIAEKLEPRHVLSVKLQDAQRQTWCQIDQAYAEQLCAMKGVAWALVEGEATIGCGGLIEMWPNRALCWSLISNEAFPHFRTIHRMVRDVLNDSPWRRIEMDVEVGHEAAYRWAEHLGFVNEGRRNAYTADGRDAYLFARIK